MADKTDKSKAPPKTAAEVAAINAERAEQGKLIGQGLGEILQRALGTAPAPTPTPKPPRVTVQPWWADRTLWIVGGGSLALLGLLAILTRSGSKKR